MAADPVSVDVPQLVAPWLDELSEFEFREVQHVTTPTRVVSQTELRAHLTLDRLYYLQPQRANFGAIQQG
ncbi:MAG: hypothetical protein KC613_26630 [Myxococcales bacterium]|nr:hypothetical protein [Myxococcales bacterium]